MKGSGERNERRELCSGLDGAYEKKETGEEREKEEERGRNGNI
jgi:hypothetical protein